jgi:hypothetical protein
MTLNQLKSFIIEFQNNVRLYRVLLSQSRDRIVPEIRSNHEAIAQMRSTLNAYYGRIELYIKKFGNNPKMRDRIHPEYYFAYPNAFSNDVLIRVGHSVDAVLQDLDYILGKLTGMTEDEFNQALLPPKPVLDTPQLPNKNYWQLTNPFCWLWLSVKWIRQHKIISVIVTLIGLLAIDYSLAWQNIVWIKNFVSGLKIFK